MDTQIYAKRREKLRELLNKVKLDALLVSHPANRFYLSGFELHDGQCNETSGHLLITTKGEDYLCTDSRFYEEASSLWDEDKIFLYRGVAVEDIRLFCIEKMGTKSIGVEANIVSHNFFEELAPSLKLEPVDNIVEALRIIKDDTEIACLTQSAKLNHEMFAWLPSILTPGKNEAELAYAIETYFREHGATENSFSPIVAINTHAARPHHIPCANTYLTENCHVLIDVGARYQNYCSDQTRTFWIGNKIDTRFQNMLAQVQEAQKAAINALRPGVSMKDIHETAIAVFAKYGTDSFFTHSLGHGIGLEVHETPRLSTHSTQKLQAGMVVTVEPGIYYGDYGGVRWEHMVLITENASQIL